MRVIAGELGGRRLRSARGEAKRPTAARVREALFSMLGELGGELVLDLFAGSGALGIEALSRGAAFALFVDDGAEARALLRENVAALGLGGTSKVFRRDATKLGEPQPLPPFSLSFLDPPYGQGLATAALDSARAGGWLTPDGLIVVEEATKAQFAAPAGFREIDRRRYDDTEFVFLRPIR
jgi:16S rRNA (guanine966-N2)-methyltransferase